MLFMLQVKLIMDLHAFQTLSQALTLTSHKHSFVFVLLLTFGFCFFYLALLLSSNLEE